MQRQVRTRSPEAIIGSIARRQHGVVGRWQLLAAGVSAMQVRVRLEGGRLREMHRGVYLVGVVPGAHTHEMAALLALRLRGTLSHRSAAALWNLLPYPAAAPVWVTISPGRTATRPGLKVIRARLDPVETRRRERMALTSPPRTILDMAALLDRYELEALVAAAQFRRLATDAERRNQIARCPGRRGVRSLRDLLDLPGGPRRTRSPAERRLLRLLRSNGIEGYEVNARIHGYEVDFLWRDLGFAVEVDGYEGHGGRVAVERDRLKWARLGAAGISVMPVSGRQIRADPDGVIRRLLAALEARRRVQ